LPAELLRVDPQTPEIDALRYAAHFLVRGSVIAIPTDTFYGLAADPFNLAAVDELYRVKGRPETRALPILVNSLEQALVLMRQGLLEGTTMEHPPRNFTKLAQAFWPGGLTLVVEASNRVPLKVTANTGKVALRWPKHPVVEQLIDEFGGPITGTSANISGFPACANTDQLMKQLGLRLPLVPAKPVPASPPPSSASRTKTGKSSAKAPSPSTKSNPSSSSLGAVCNNVGPVVSAGSDLLASK
jgi:L-threonylcarbamoyladenylate synthase